MSAVSNTGPMIDTGKLLALLVARNPSADAAVQKAVAALEANQAQLQDAAVALASGTQLDLMA